MHLSISSLWRCQPQQQPLCGLHSIAFSASQKSTRVRALRTTSKSRVAIPNSESAVRLRRCHRGRRRRAYIPPQRSAHVPNSVRHSAQLTPVTFTSWKLLRHCVATAASTSGAAAGGGCAAGCPSPSSLLDSAQVMSEQAQRSPACSVLLRLLSDRADGLWRCRGGRQRRGLRLAVLVALVGRQRGLQLV